MNMNEIILWTLLGMGVLGFSFTSLGLLMTRDVYNQVHYLAPGSLIGSVAIAAAIIVREHLSALGAKTILISILLLVSNPVLSHLILRAARIRGGQPMTPEELP